MSACSAPERQELKTYHVADICALDEQSTCQVLLFFLYFGTPSVDHALVMRNLLLQVTQVAHVLEMEAHVCRKYIVDHELAHRSIIECTRPITA